jgi:hypothetical protein
MRCGKKTPQTKSTGQIKVAVPKDDHNIDFEDSALV